MAQKRINFKIRQGGSGRPLPNNDHISGLIFYSDTLPSGFTLGDNRKPIFSVQEAEDLGINDLAGDETKATDATVQITGAGAAGEVVKITIDGVTIATFTVGDTPAINDTATGLSNAINEITNLTGFTSTVATDTVTIIAPTGLGTAINGSTVALDAATATATIVQFTGGVGSFFSVMYYYISEFFRMQPKGKLWVGIYPVDTYDGSEITDLMNYTNGELRQVAVYNHDETFATSHISATQSAITTLAASDKRLIAMLASNFTGLALATLPDGSIQNAPQVSVTIAQDGNWNFSNYSDSLSYVIGDKVNHLGSTYIANSSGIGQSVYDSAFWTNISKNLKVRVGYSVPALGTMLGSVALFNVANNIGWVGGLDTITDGNNLDEAGFVTGELYKDVAEGLLDNLDAKRYIFLRTYAGTTGVRWNDTYTFILNSDDLSTIELNRVMDKAIRSIKTNETPLINAPVTVAGDGTLPDITIATYKNAVDRALLDMQTAGEISNFISVVDPEQDVITQGKIIISISIQPIGVSRFIDNNIGFVTNIT